MEVRNSVATTIYMTTFSNPRENKHNPGAYGIVIWHAHITKLCRKPSTYSSSWTKMSLRRNHIAYVTHIAAVFFNLEQETI